MTAEKPLVSVVVPARDRARFLGACLRSVLAQTYRPLEIVAVDDGSVDGTLALLRKLDFPTLKVVHHPRPLGAPASRNDGIAVAEGELIAFLDSDDLWYPRKLELQAALFKDPKVMYVSSDADWMDGRGRLVQRGTRVYTPGGRLVRHGRPFHNSTVVLRRSGLARVGGLHESFALVSDDVDLRSRFFKRFGPRAVRFIGRPLARYRYHPAQLMRSALPDAGRAGEFLLDHAVYRYRQGRTGPAC